MAEEKKIDLRWTTGLRKKFIRLLAETYDVEAACAETGLSWPDICTLRVKHPDFAAAFDEVIAAGYDRLEAKLLREAGVGRDEVNPVLGRELLKQRRAANAERAARRSGPARPPRAQTIRAILDTVAPLREAAMTGSGMSGLGHACASRSGALVGAA
jgi:hypothetical protein